MIYLKRDSNQQIIDLSFHPEPGYEKAMLFDPEIKQFLLENLESETLIRNILQKLDQDLVRSIEDLVDVLIQKELILFTDLPEAVQNKLLFKKSIRSTLQEETGLLHEEEELNF
jgi:hypothetical protein